jgi:hypothetical protein
MTKATIRTKSGAVVTIVGSQSEVSMILAELEALVAGTKERARPQSPATHPPRAKPSGPSGLLLGLKAEGFFDKPKALGDIARAVEEKGFLIPTTTLSGVVLALLQKGLLHRKRTEGRWIYGN